jgi:hypothetical protein
LIFQTYKENTDFETSVLFYEFNLQKNQYFYRLFFNDYLYFIERNYKNKGVLRLLADLVLRKEFFKIRSDRVVDQKLVLDEKLVEEIINGLNDSDLGGVFVRCVILGVVSTKRNLHKIFVDLIRKLEKMDEDIDADKEQIYLGMIGNVLKSWSVYAGKNLQYEPLVLEYKLINSMLLKGKSVPGFMSGYHQYLIAYNQSKKLQEFEKVFVQLKDNLSNFDQNLRKETFRCLLQFEQPEFVEMKDSIFKGPCTVFFF